MSGATKAWNAVLVCIPIPVQLWACLHTRAFGRVRHIEVGELWIQYVVKRGVLNVQKVKGEYNPADILTKHVEKGNIHQHCHAMGLAPEIGRPAAAPATIV